MKSEALEGQWFRRTAIGAALVLECAVSYALTVFNQVLPMAGDNLALGLPLRFLFSWNLWNNGEVALWDPMSAGGTPLVSAYIPLVASPVVWALSLMGPYSVTSFSLEMLVLVSLSIVGMYFWIRRGSPVLVALVGSMAYGLGPYVLMQSQINLEAVGTAASIPIIALGATRIWAEDKVLASTVAR